MTERERPLSPDEQRVLEEIERRLHEEDPRLARAAAGTAAFTYTARRLRLGILGLIVGLILLMLFPISIWIAAVGFVVTVGSAVLVYQQVRRLGQDQIREWSSRGRMSPSAFLARMADRMRGRRGQQR